jgi:hypothetical protein
MHFFWKTNGLGKFTAGFSSINRHETKFDLVWVNWSVRGVTETEGVRVF